MLTTRITLAAFVLLTPITQCSSSNGTVLFHSKASAGFLHRALALQLSGHVASFSSVKDESAPLLIQLRRCDWNHRRETFHCRYNGSNVSETTI